MHRNITSLALVLMLSACQLATVSVQPAHKATLTKGIDPDTAASSRAPSPPPQAKASVVHPAETIPAFAKLVRPAGIETTMLGGSIAIDASYAVSAGGTVVSSNGARILSVGGGQLVSNNGGTLISDKGSGVVASGAGNVIADNTGSLISENGGGLVAAQNAGGAAASHLHIQDTGASSAPSQATSETLEVGTVLPAAGMQIEVVTLEDGRPVSLGSGPDGKPVFSIYSNFEGKYEVFVPKTLVHNVLIKAAVPKNLDPRLAYGLISSPTSTSAAIDEASSSVARFLRTVMQGKLAEIASAPNFDDPTFLEATFPPIKKFPIYAGVMKLAATRFRARMQLDHLAADRIPAAAAAGADAVMAFVHLPEVKISPPGTQWGGSADEAALPAMVSILDGVSAAAQANIKKNGPNFFNAQPFVVDVNRNLASGLPAFTIVKPADLPDFIVNQYLATNKPQTFEKLYDIFTSLGVERTEVDHLFAANNGFALAVGLVFAQDAEAQDAVDRAIDRVAAGR
jgi:hypothetical protein